MHRLRIALVVLALSALAPAARAEVPLSGSVYGLLTLPTSTNSYAPGGMLRVMTSLSEAVSVGVEASMVDLGETGTVVTIPLDTQSGFFGTMPGRTLLYQMGPIVRLRSKPARARTHLMMGLPLFEMSSDDSQVRTYGFMLGGGISGSNAIAPSVEFRWAGLANPGYDFPDQYLALAVGVSIR